MLVGYLVNQSIVLPTIALLGYYFINQSRSTGDWRSDLIKLYHVYEDVGHISTRLDTHVLRAKDLVCSRFI